MLTAEKLFRQSAVFTLEFSRDHFPGFSAADFQVEIQELLGCCDIVTLMTRGAATVL